MFKVLFLAFLLVPLTELFVLIQVGAQIGALSTIALCLFTAALGAFLFRLQGLETLKRVQDRIEHGEMPATDLVEGFILLISGLLLLTPGFVTDILGFLCLVPVLRTRIATFILGRVLLIQRSSAGRRTVIVEGEFWDHTDKVDVLKDDSQEKNRNLH
jgi:UPF0716 protein FxsA